MNKIKVIDLFNMISKEKEVPKEIKYKGWLFAFDRQPQDYYCEEYGNLFEYLINEKRTSEFLNEEVEIIQEDEKIEYIECRIKDFKHYIEDSCFSVQPLEDLELNQNEIVIIDKINEIIKKINKLETK